MGTVSLSLAGGQSYVFLLGFALLQSSVPFFLHLWGEKKKNADISYISNYPGEPGPGSSSPLPVNCPSLITSGSFQLHVSTS